MQELVVESLVVSLTLVMLDVLVDDEAQMPLAERDDTMEAFFFEAIFTTPCAIRSATVGMPNGREPPWRFLIATRLTGGGK